MKYLSQIQLPAVDAACFRFDNGEVRHRFVYNLFRDEVEKKQRILFVFKEHQSSGLEVLILSDVRPASPSFGSMAVKQLDIDALREFSQFRFEVVLNPVRRNSRQRSHQIITDRAEQLSWFDKLAERNGFRVLSAEVQSCDVLKIRDVKRKAFSVHQITVRGVLQVSAASDFFDAVSSGIGRSKAYGCGLLQLAPLS